MIGRLRGELVALEGVLATVECAGVGYEVLVPDSVAAYLPAVGETTTLLVRQIFREDGTLLCGFLESFQRRLFDLLLTVQGCGPKVALALIGQLGAETVAGAVLAQDARTLARATGVGPKLAERIILEIRAKMQDEAALRRIEAVTGTKPTKTAPKSADELVDALLALGYRRAEAEAAAETARAETTGVSDQVRHALRLLQK